ncbi:MAG TPA: ABC transporter substrate-binding protein, partial [Acidimicrobiia bacterium]|nr:ABC transporter substrate-binding protein [Acidimicrobiia bacterium]
GTALLPIAQGAQLWVAAVNQTGGLNGHPVKLRIYDDGADPARHRASVQQAVEKDGAIAFLANAEAITGQASLDYVNDKRVPVIGMSGGEEWAYSSPLYFPQMTAGYALYKTFVYSIAGQAIAAGKRKLGTLTCVEAATCADTDRIFAAEAKAAGMELVYRGRASLAQPDYTAECLAARNQGAEVIMPVLDPTSISRAAASCVRQGYRPLWGIPMQGVADSMKGDPNLAGAVASTSTFPYFQTGTPATDEFQRALRSFGGHVTLGPALSSGWTAGKLLERAGARLGEPPTSGDLLAGLWSIDRDTLGGLTIPLTFRKDEPPQRITCWFNMTITDRTWTSPDRYGLHCL